MTKPKTIFLDQCGPYVCYSEGALEIHDLNPQIDIKWHLSRWELFKFGVACLWSAIFPAPKQ